MDETKLPVVGWHGKVLTGKALKISLSRAPNGAAKHDPIYRIWCAMRERCSNPHNKRFARYGGRGIRVCQRWDSFQAFKDDMGPRPPGTTLDRVNNNGDYEASNCRWASSTVQARNSSNNRLIEHDGQTLTLADWAERLGMCAETIAKRLDRGWTVSAALMRPADRRRTGRPRKSA